MLVGYKLVEDHKLIQDPVWIQTEVFTTHTLINQTNKI